MHLSSNHFKTWAGYLHAKSSHETLGQEGRSTCGGTLRSLYTPLAKVVDAVVGLRVDEEGEFSGLDLVEHGEVGYDL